MLRILMQIFFILRSVLCWLLLHLRRLWCDLETYFRRFLYQNLLRFIFTNCNIGINLLLKRYWHIWTLIRAYWNFNFRCLRTFEVLRCMKIEVWNLLLYRHRRWGTTATLGNAWLLTNVFCLLFDWRLRRNRSLAAELEGRL
jgi:hypothetical protein